MKNYLILVKTGPSGKVLKNTCIRINGFDNETLKHLFSIKYLGVRLLILRDRTLLPVPSNGSLVKQVIFSAWFCPPDLKRCTGFICSDKETANSGSEVFRSPL